MDSARQKAGAEAEPHPEVKLFDIDTSSPEEAATPKGTLDLNGLLATLSSEAPRR